MDEGYQFGLGAFETIAVEDNHPVFLTWHIERLEKAMKFLNFFHKEITEQTIRYLQKNPIAHGALKIIVSRENINFLKRENPYTKEQYQRGFCIDFSEVRRNETSPLVCYKTMNYGDCILEKRRAARDGLDEVIFLNMKGEISEGTATNIFFVRKGEVYTPKQSCGLLPGIMRRYVIETVPTKETVILPEYLSEFEECFVTNSLLGIMHVRTIGKWKSKERKMAERLTKQYEKEKRKDLLHGLGFKKRA